MCLVMVAAVPKPTHRWNGWMDETLLIYLGKSKVFSFVITKFFLMRIGLVICWSISNP